METIGIVQLSAEALLVFSLPMRDGNKAMDPARTTLYHVFSLPMRDGNFRGNSIPVSPYLGF